jgi:hypothetical protein
MSAVNRNFPAEAQDCVQANEIDQILGRSNFPKPPFSSLSSMHNGG